jgi:hypothetical protein
VKDRQSPKGLHTSLVARLVVISTRVGRRDGFAAMKYLANGAEYELWRGSGALSWMVHISS